MTWWRSVPLIAGPLLSAVILANPAAAADLESAWGVDLPSAVGAGPGVAGGDKPDDRVADPRDAAPHGHGRAPAPASTYEG